MVKLNFPWKTTTFLACSKQSYHKIQRTWHIFNKLYGLILIIFYSALWSFLSSSPHPLPLYGKEQHWHSSKHLLLCSTEQRNSHGYGTTWGWVNDDRTLILRWTIPLNHKPVLSPHNWHEASRLGGRERDSRLNEKPAPDLDLHKKKHRALTVRQKKIASASLLIKCT